MCPFMIVLLPLLLIVRRSLAEDYSEIEFEGRWITRAPKDTEFPYAVYIVMTENETCSGSLIAMDLVLTAARCVYEGKNIRKHKSLTIYAGVDKLPNNGLELPDTVQQRRSKEILIEDPRRNNFFSIALVRTDRPFDVSKGGKTVRNLSLELDVKFDPIMEQACRSGSYGRLEWDEKSPEVALKKTLNLIQRCNCSESLQKVFPDVATKQWMCGEHSYDIGACRGDFGASIKCGTNFIGVVINIVTFREGTCEVTDPVSKECSKESTVTIYTDVCYHLNWIHKYVKNFRLNRKSCEGPGSAPSVHAPNCLLYLICFHFWLLW